MFSSNLELFLYRWPGTMVPVVRFLNNRERLMLPEAFKSEVAAVGTCQRTQVILMGPSSKVEPA